MQGDDRLHLKGNIWHVNQCQKEYDPIFFNPVKNSCNYVFIVCENPQLFIN